MTVACVLRDAGLQQRVLRRQSGGLSPAPAHLIPTEPNDLWTVDFKGWWRAKDGTRCDPLTVRDGFSRYVLALQLLKRTRTEDVRPIFERLFDFGDSSSERAVIFERTMCAAFADRCAAAAG